jgi:hypothetical protein
MQREIDRILALIKEIQEIVPDSVPCRDKSLALAILRVNRGLSPNSVAKYENTKKALVSMVRSLALHLCDEAEKKDRVFELVMFLLETAKSIKGGGSPNIIKRPHSPGPTAA